MSDFYKDRNILCHQKINILLNDLPYFCRDFFLGVEHTTTPLTRLNYAYDLRIFFDFLHQFSFPDIDIKEISLKEVNLIDATDIEYFLSYLTNYTFNGNNYSKSCR